MSTAGCATVCACTFVHMDIYAVCMYGCSREWLQKHMCEHTHARVPLLVHTLAFIQVCGPVHLCMSCHPIEQVHHLEVSTHPGSASGCISERNILERSWSLGEVMHLDLDLFLELSHSWLS